MVNVKEDREGTQEVIVNVGGEDGEGREEGMVTVKERIEREQRKRW